MNKSDIFSESFFSLSKLLCEIKQYLVANEKLYLPELNQNAELF